MQRFASTSFHSCPSLYSTRCFLRQRTEVQCCSLSMRRIVLPVLPLRYYHSSTARSALATTTDNATARILSIPTQYLRAMDASNFDPVTLQRTDVSFDVQTGKPLVPAATMAPSPEILECSCQGDHYRIVWKDGLVSKYSSKWVENTLQKWKGETNTMKTNRVLWTGLTEDKVRSSPSLSISFDDTISEKGVAVALRALYEYGILLVNDTPTDDGGAGIAALASALGGGAVKNKTSLLTKYNYNTRGMGGGRGGNAIVLPRGTDGPMRTLYGTVWSTTSSGQADGASVADSAYGHEALPLHTDMTYHRDPPGLQIFTMVEPSVSGGASIFGDGFAVADRLRRTNPEAFWLLARTVRRYRCVDYETGWHLEASGPVISVVDDDNENNAGEVVMIRHNDLDRLPDLPPPSSSDAEVNDFYAKLQAAHLAWDQILAEDDMRLVIGLQPGDTIVVANQRCFHGRYGFDANLDSPRIVMGCYVSQDELNSRFRLQGYRSY